MSDTDSSEASRAIHYSRGRDKFDNEPVQQTAPDFDQFEVAVLADRSPQKGLAFVCAPLARGSHYQKPSTYPGNKHWRLKDHVQPRRFIAFDFDGFADPDAFQATLAHLARYRSFFYTTASHSPQAPRARAILEVNRPVDRDEAIRLCESLQSDMRRALGPDAILFDDSVYRGEQPVYTPVATSETFHFAGACVDADQWLTSSPAPDQVPPQFAAAISSELTMGIAPAFVVPDQITDGEGREGFILQYAGHLRGKGLDQAAVDQIALDYNRCHILPPLPEDVVIDRARRYQAPALVIAANNAEHWPEPQEIQATLPAVPAFDARMLPPIFREWVTDIAERMQCPVDFLAVGAMVAAGSVVGNRMGIQPKHLDTGWVEVPNLWGAIVGRPGVMKSPALAQVHAPLKRLERQAQAAFAVTHAQHQIAKMQHEASMKQIEASIKKGAAVLPGQLPVCPDEPQPKRHLINDATYQKIGQVLSGNPHGLMVFQDELSGLLMRLDSSGQESSRAFFLEAWDGKQSYTFDRIERGTVSIPRLCFSVMGGLQPSKLREYLRSAVFGGKGDDGLAQRLQMLVYPDIAPAWTHVDRQPNLAAAQAAENAFDRLSSIESEAIGANVPLGDGVPALHFDEDAQRLFDQWWFQLENNLRRGDRHPALESHISKYRKLVPALALLDHLIVGQTGNVKVASLKRAIAWQRFLLAHAHRCYACVTSATMDSAKALSNHIQRAALSDGFTIREVYRHNWSMLSNVKEVTEAAEVLVDFGWLRPIHDKRQDSTDGRPTVRYYINPRLKRAA
ncbi:MAG: YfjI family protein [Rhodoferax sp.]|uniref:YfjI family protein n=1 Tax=Rhodoferax sp. TaxID=50421 RepID=UPI00273600E6|nr:YfjI family protein [Rhodoferax sp.]MDP3864363.1 YfjI family protein [Rhodoferax sp.]